MSGVKGKSGRKKKTYDLSLVESLGALDCTHPEMAAMLEVSQRTVDSLMEDGESSFLASYKKGQGRSKISLRRTLRRLADEGNIPAAIFLAKNRLGMTDYQVHVQVDVKQLIAQCDISEADFNRVKGRIDRGEYDFGDTKLIEVKGDGKEDG